MDFTKETFVAVFNSAPDAIIVADKEGKIVAANNKVETLFGYSHEEIAYLTVENLLPSHLKQNHQEHRNSFYNNPRFREMDASEELLAKRKDGSNFYVEISLSPISLNNEVFVSASIRDVSEKIALTKKLKETLAVLEQKNKELEQFAFLVSHDLQEPLKTIISLVGLIEEECEDKMDETSRFYIESIGKSTTRMSKLIEALLEFSRIGNYKETTAVNTAYLLNEIKADLAAAIEQSEAVINWEYLPIVKGQSTHLRMLFQNLIGNAIKFRKREGKAIISITVKSEGQHWVFAIEDNGIGIEKDNLEKIFVIFNRLHSRAAYEGTGIGLAHCKKIVELHGGKIWVESTLGFGSTFYFTLPMV